MAKKKTPQQNYITTELGKRLYDYNGESQPTSLNLLRNDSKLGTEFKQPVDNTPDYMKGVSAIGEFYDYTPESYDGDIYADQLGDLDNIRSQNQGVFNSLGNTTMNFLGKTAVNVVGGVVGAIYGAGSAIANGDLSKLWDNDLTQKLDESSDAIGEYFKVYKSSDYQDKFILNKMFSNPLMFTDEFMDTLSFTAAAVATEMLTGGMASGGVASSAMNYFNKLVKTTKGLDALGDVSKVSGAINKAGAVDNIFNGLEKAGKLTRQLGTGAFWEASVEARQLGVEMRQNMINDYIAEQENNGVYIDPENIPPDVMADIDNRIENASAAALAMNVGLVGFSNLSQFPTIFKTMGNAKKAAAKNISEQMVDGVSRFTSNFDNLSKTQRNLLKTWSAVKNPFMEGFVEEGGQGVISGTMGSFFDRKNDLDGISETEQFVKSFSQAFADTYFTKEGLNEVLMGALVGGVGSPGNGMLSVLGKDNAIGKHGFEKIVDSDGTVSYQRKNVWDGGVVSGMREFNQEIQESRELANQLNNQPDLLKSLKANYDAQVRTYSLNKDLDDAIDNNDHFEFNNAKDNLLYNYISTRLDLGMQDDLNFKVEELENMSADDFYVTFKGEEATKSDSKENKDLFKSLSIQKLKNSIESVINSKNTVNSLLQDIPDSDFKQAVGEDLAYYLAKADLLNIREKDIYRTIAEKSENNIVKPKSNVGTTIKQAISNLEKLVKEDPSSENKKRLAQLKSFNAKYGDELPSSFAVSLFNYAEAEPAKFKALEPELDLMLRDLPLINQYKKNLIKLYDTVKDLKNFEKYGEFLSKLDEQRVKDAETAKADTQAKEVAKQNQDALDAEKNNAKSATDKPVEEVIVEEPLTDEQLEEAAEEEERLADSIEETDESSDQEGQSEEATPENTSEEKYPYAKNFDKYQAADNELLNKLIDKPFLRNISDHVENIKNKYVQYRNSRTDLADVGTPRDIEDFNKFVQAGYTSYENFEEDPNTDSPINTDSNDDPSTEEVETEQTPEFNNTDKISQDEVITEKQVANPENLPENPEDTTGEEPIADNVDDSLLDDYRGVSLVNIHARKKTIDGKFTYVRDNDGKYEILPSYPKSALLPTIGLAGSKVNVRVATLDEYAKHADNYNVDTVYDNAETLPLVAEQDGKFIGFILTPKGAASSSKNRISSEDLNKLKSFREYVFKNQNKTFELNVLEKTMGVVTYRKDKEGKSIYRPISEHLSKDGNTLADDVHIAVDVNGVLHTNSGTEFNGELINYSYGNGLIYSLIPLANGQHVKIPLRMSDVNDQDALTVIEALRYFTANVRNPNDTGYISLRNELQSTTGINLGNINEFYNNLNNIIYINTSGPNQFFSRGQDPDGSYHYILSSPGGMKVKIKQKDLNNPGIVAPITSFIKEHFYRGVRVQVMNNNKYNHLKLDGNKLSVDNYNNYTEYLIKNDVLLSDVYGEPIDDYSNKMSFVLAPFIKIAYPSVGQYSIKETPTTNEDNYNEDLRASDRAELTKDSFLDDIAGDNDDFDINFSLLDIQNDINEIISPDVENEIDNFIKFCK